MDNAKIILVWNLVLVTPSLQQFTDLLPRFKPSCRNRSADIRFVSLDVQLTPLFEFDDDFRIVNLSLEAKWEADFSDENLPGEIPLDGFAVHFMSIEEKRNYSIPNHSDTPTSPCLSGSEHVWVKTSNVDACGNTTIDEYCTDTYPDFCLCPLANCTLVPKLPCRGIAELLQDNQDNFQTIPSTTRSLVFPIKLNLEYEFAITPYYRQFANGHQDTTVNGIIDCQNLFPNSFKDDIEMRRICCLNNITNVVAYNVLVSEVRPVFARAVNATTINLTLSWLPPGNGEEVNKFQLFIESRDANAELSPIRKLPYDAPAAVGSSSPCEISKYIYEVEMYNLIPGIDYLLHITTNLLESSPNFKSCSDGHCRVIKEIHAQEPLSLCDEDFQLCHPSATCENAFDPSTGRNATCTCGPGLEGDGLNSDMDLGSGCTEINGCATALNECAELATCTDQPAPSTSVKCHCADGYYGDGKASGSGCRSSAATALAIALPIVAVLIIIAAVITWYIIRERKRKLDERFQRYVAIDNGILSHLNDGADEEKGPWEPTFGVQWEINRKNIRFGKVLGRGNFGIVLMAWLSTESDQTETNGNVSCENGDFCDPVSPKVTGEYHYEEMESYSRVVAVKRLQESTQNRENLANFLEEIGFMLNIGEHENIVQVYGCTTVEEPVYMITEYMPYGDLLHFLWDARELSNGLADPVYKVTEESLSGMAKDIASAMAYLEQIRVVHGDIAARNVLVGKEGICKLTDFGLANDVYRYGWSKGDKERLVPFKWISPERMMPGQMPITSKSDVWSFGNLMYEMFTLGCPPYPGIEATDLLHLLRSGYRMERPKSCNEQVYDVMYKCWQWRASSRPNFRLLLKFLDRLIHYFQSRGQVNVATAVEELDREEYTNELKKCLQDKENRHVNGQNLTVVANEPDKQTGTL